MNWKTWLHSIVAAAVSAAATGFTTVVVSPQTFNFTHQGLINLASVCGLSALLAVATLLKQSPLPPNPEAPTSAVSGGAAVAMLLCGALLLTTAGCAAQSTIAELIAVVGTATASLETIEGNTAAVVAIQADTKAAEDAVLNWKSGTPAQDVIAALNILQDDLNLLPVSTADQAYVDLAIGTVDQILTLIPAPATPPAVATPATAVLANVAFFANSARPHHRHPHLAKTPKSAKEFRKEWNKLAQDGQPHLAIILPTK